MVDAYADEFVFDSTHVDAFLTRDVTSTDGAEQIYLLCSPGGALGSVTYIGIVKRRHVPGYSLFLLCERSRMIGVRDEMQFLNDVLAATKALYSDCVITLIVEDNLHKEAVHYADSLCSDDWVRVMCMSTTARETEERIKYMRSALAAGILTVEPEGRFIATHPQLATVSKQNEARTAMLLQLRFALVQFVKMTGSVGCVTNYRMPLRQAQEKTTCNEDLAHLFLELASAIMYVRE